jgi:flagellar assembly factor FliW
MIVETRFHGPLTVRPEEIITLDYEILGFPDQRHFVLLPHRADSPFLYFQSTTNASLAFVVIDPLLVMADYRLPLEELPDLGDPSLWAILCLCSIGRGTPATVNLRSPLIINRETRRGGQFVLSLPYSHQHPLFKEVTHART